MSTSRGPEADGRPAAKHGAPVGDALLDAFDRAAAPVRLFIRDDDAGWADDRLHALLDVTADAGVPIDLAVIPTAVTPALASALLERRRRQPIGLHQHGHAHLNHEHEARKCEFGSARSALERQHDLAEGRRRMREAFGDAVDDIFTPPWNRCAPDSPAQLAALGFAALSRDAGAPAQHHLPELPVHLDWTRELRRAAAAGAEAAAWISAQVARHLNGSDAVGLMLHHAAMDDAELRLLARLLRAWRAHPRARWMAMHGLLAEVPA